MCGVIVITMKKPKILVIVGPTASGKTSLSIALAQKYAGEIVSADSRQVYKGLDLGTGKVTTEEMCGIPHHLLDVTNPMETYTVADYVRDGHIAISSILSQNKLPIIIGGTFFYIDALLGRVSTPYVQPNEKLRTLLEEKTTETLSAELIAKDPQRASSVDKHNRRRLIRALEIIDALGHVPAPVETESPYETLILGIDVPKESLYERIDERIQARITLGMIEEVKSLHTNGIPYKRMEDLGIEYKYIARFLQGQLTEDTLIEQLNIKSRQYAKRQMTWLKRDRSIIWINPTDMATIEHKIESFLSTDR